MWVPTTTRTKRARATAGVSRGASGGGRGGRPPRRARQLLRPPRWQQVEGDANRLAEDEQRRRHCQQQHVLEHVPGQAFVADGVERRRERDADHEPAGKQEGAAPPGHRCASASRPAARCARCSRTTPPTPIRVMPPPMKTSHSPRVAPTVISASESASQTVAGLPSGSVPPPSTWTERRVTASARASTRAKAAAPPSSAGVETLVPKRITPTPVRTLRKAPQSASGG